MKSVLNARLHESVFIAGYGDVGTLLPPVSGKGITFNMFVDALGLHVIAQKNESSPEVHTLVPTANVKGMELAPSSSSEPKLKAVKSA